MAAKKVGELIREARTEAGLTQEALAKKVKTLSSADISKAERGEKELSQEELKTIAKITGVTQKSLLDAAKGVRTTTGQTRITTGKTATAKKTTTGTTMKVTATEKRLVELYRAADSDTKKAAMSLLKGEVGENGGILDTLYKGLMDSLKMK